jgi:menaquinone-dependent protoporphyrinogen IX oxidase
MPGVHTLESITEGARRIVMTSSSADRKVLVTYYSVTGNTARVARDVAKVLGADVESIQDKSHGVGFVGYLKAVIDAVRGVTPVIGMPTHSPRNYALTVIGTPVWAWHMTPAVRAYLRTCREQFGDVAFFVTSGDTDASKVVPEMESVGGHKALAYAGFNARELANRDVYDRKIQEFARMLRAARPKSDIDVGAPLPVR